MNKSELVYEVTNRLDVTRKEAEDVISRSNRRKFSKWR